MLGPGTEPKGTAPGRIIEQKGRCTHLCSDLFLYDLLFLETIRHIVCNCGGRSAQRDAQHCAAEDIGGKVHIEVQPGKGDKGCQHQRGRAQLPVLQPERVGGCHPGSGVPGGEGVPVRSRHQHGDGGVDIAGAGAGEQWLEEEVPRRHVQHQRHRHGKARFAGAPEEQEQQGERDPDLAVGTGVIKKDGDRIHYRVAELVQPVQKSKLKGHGFLLLGGERADFLYNIAYKY